MKYVRSSYPSYGLQNTIVQQLHTCLLPYAMHFLYSLPLFTPFYGHVARLFSCMMLEPGFQGPIPVGVSYFNRYTQRLRTVSMQNLTGTIVNTLSSLLSTSDHESYAETIHMEEKSCSIDPDCSPQPASSGSYQCSIFNSGCPLFSRLQ